MLPPILVELKASSTQFMATMGEARKEIGKLDSASHKHFAAVAAVGKASFIGLVSGAVAVGGESLKMADQFEKSHAQLVAAMGGAGLSMDTYKGQISAVSRQMENLGFSNADTQSALAQLVISTGSATTGAKDMAVAADLARYKNIPLAQAALLVSKALEGQLRPLKALGLDLPIAAGGAHNLELAQTRLQVAQQAVTDVLAKYPHAAEAGARGHAQYEAATRRVTAAQLLLGQQQGESTLILNTLQHKLKGQATEAAKTFGGQLGVMSTKVTDVGAQLGLVLIPMIESAIAVTTRAVGWLAQHKGIAEALAVTIGVGLTGAIATWVAKLAWGAGKATLDFAKMSAKAVAWAAKTVAQGVVVAAKFVASTAASMAQLAAKSALAFAGMVAKAALWAASMVVQGAIAMAPFLPWILLIGAVGIAAYELYKHWHQVWGFIKTAVSDAWSFVKTIFNAVVQGGLWVVKREIQGLQTIWNTAWTAVKNAVSDAWNFIKPIIDSITSAISGAVSAISGLTGGIGKVAGGIGSVLTGHIPGFANGVQNFPGGLALVGERGPELVSLPRGSNVYPHGTGPSHGATTIHVEAPITIQGNLDRVTLTDVHDALESWTQGLMTEIQSGRR